MTVTHLRNSVEWALMVALVFGAGAFAQAEDQGKETKGHIVQIGPDNTKVSNSSQTDPSDPTATATPGTGQQATGPEQPRYWIGLMGGPIPAELRAHLDIPENQGVIVRSVVADSPAAKAGVKNFDIVLRANDADLHDMRDLMELVKTAGDQKASISLDVLRKGGRETITVTPGERPAHVVQQFAPNQEGQRQEGQGGGFGAMPGAPNDMMQWFQQFGGGEQGGGRPFAFRQFGPGVVVNGQMFGAAAVPNGVSVSIQKQNNEPAHVTVKRGNDSWEVVGDDPESLKQLPEDLQPFVEQMLGQSHQGVGNFNLPVPPQGMHGMMPGMMPQMGDDHDQDLQTQLDAMKAQLKELEQRLGPASTKPSDAK